MLSTSQRLSAAQVMRERLADRCQKSVKVADPKSFEIMSVVS